MLRIVVIVAFVLIAAISTSAAIAISPSQGIAHKGKLYGLR